MTVTVTRATAERPAPAKRSKVRADIQALRAIAVLLVVANHLWPTRLTGGFVGVDVFFVISGFLITGHLLGEVRRTDTVSLARFFARRARRLLPAALLVGAATLAATIAWMPAERWPRIAREVFASAAYFENWLLTASSVNYSDRGQPATPAQHYWSLSVEEQFYLLWPVTLVALGWLVTRNRPGRVTARPRALFAAIAALGVTSFAFSLWQTSTNPAAAYFNTFGRVWEFMLGALIAVAAPYLLSWFALRPAMSLRGVAQLAGYAMILVSALRFTDATPFPGPWALLPAFGTALVIAAGPEMPRWTPARLAFWRPVTYVGNLSYSLYLWHWPIIVTMPFALAREVRTLDRFVMLALSVVLAILTKHFVEDPGRTRLFANAHPRRTLLATLASVAVIALFTGGTIIAATAAQTRETARIDAAVGSSCFGAGALDPENNCSEPFGPALFPAGAESEAPWATTAKECAPAPENRQIMADGKPSYTECSFAPSRGDSQVRPYTVWVLGDSHAEHWKAAVNDLGRGNSWDVRYTTQGGCPSVATPLSRAFGIETEQSKRDACSSWITEVSERVLADAPDLVLVSNFASTEVVDDGSSLPQPEQLARGMNDTLKAWADAGSRVVVIHDTPMAGSSLGPRCVSLHGTLPLGCVADKGAVLPNDPQVEAVSLLSHPNITSVDLTDSFCVESTCSGVIGGVPVFFDDDHVSTSYSRSLAPMLGASLSETLGTKLRPPESANH